MSYVRRKTFEADLLAQRIIEKMGNSAKQYKQQRPNKNTVTADQLLQQMGVAL